jgi:putative membrane protein
MKKLLSFVLVFALLFTSVSPVAALGTPSQKEEVVYGILNLDGTLNNLYVVNIFNGGAITDYGNYTDIRNMTTSEKLNQSGDVITINTEAHKFYYQGALDNKELPWDISIKYFLDDKEISAAELGGKSGKLKITISVKQNPNVISTFYDNYALQISLSLDNKLCSNIIAESATLAEAGSKKQIAYTVLPASGIDAAVTADVRDFEMDAISINGIRLALGITVDSDEFTAELEELTDAIKALDGGAGELFNGLNQLSIGMQKYIDGMKAFKEGLGELTAGAYILNTGAASLRDGLLELSKQSAPLINGALAIQQATFASVNEKLSSMGLGLPVLTPENYSAVLSPIPDFAPLRAQLDGAVQFTEGLKGYVGGVAQLGQGAEELAQGTAEFKASSALIVSSANELYSAGIELNAGIKKLREGLASYKNGTKQLKNGTSKMGNEIDNKIEEMLSSISGKGDKVVSFVSEKNTNVTAVQFVLKTDSINLPKAPRAVSQKPVEPSFWQKLLRLFRL